MISDSKVTFLYSNICKSMDESALKEKDEFLKPTIKAQVRGLTIWRVELVAWIQIDLVLMCQLASHYVNSNNL